MKKIMILCIASGLFFLACASKPGFDGRGDLCGLIIDENNKPVKDFIVYCSTSGNYIQPVLTNESGLFVFPSLHSGEYKISGEKNNYLRIEKVVYRFNNRTNILCLQTKSFKAALLKAEELLYLGQTKAAMDVLEKISCEKKSPQQKLVLFFKFFALETNKEKRTLLDKIKKNTSTDLFKNLEAKLEEEIK